MRLHSPKMPRYALLRRLGSELCWRERISPSAQPKTLLRRCVERGAQPNKLSVIRNGWDPTAFPVQPPRPIPVGPLTLGFFGTIGEWLDFKALEACKSIPDVTIRLIGPNSCGYVSPHPRIILRPQVEYAALANAVSDVDVLLLPFRVTELTRAVDPVKLYEYIALGRPILAVGTRSCNNSQALLRSMME